MENIGVICDCVHRAAVYNCYGELSLEYVGQAANDQIQADRALVGLL